MDVLKGKVAIVTGGANGVGPEICRALALFGAHIAIADADGDAAAALADDLDATGARVIPIPCDPSSSPEISAAVREAADWFGTIDILVNNVMTDGADVALQDMTDRELERFTVAGPATTLRFMRACHPHLTSGGHVINIAASAAAMAIPDCVVQEWNWHGITVSNLDPHTGYDGSAPLLGDADHDLNRVLAGIWFKCTRGALVA